VGRSRSFAELASIFLGGCKAPHRTDDVGVPPYELPYRIIVTVCWAYGLLKSFKGLSARELIGEGDIAYGNPLLSEQACIALANKNLYRAAIAR